MANVRPSEVRPKTSGTSNNIAVTNLLPRISELRTAGYQKSHKNPASASAGISRPASPSACNIVRTASLIVEWANPT